MDLSRFTSDGLLPSGDHPLTIVELQQSYLVSGEGVAVPGWDSRWRAQLVDNLELFVRQLWAVGVELVFVNGSFVTNKPHPGDIDVYFECEINQYPPIIIGLLQQEPSLPWDLTRRPIDRRSGLPKPVMWHVYRVEIFPQFTDHPQPTGVHDDSGNGLYFPTLFRRDKETGMPKGVIQIIRE
jgi:Family of unknown function (DUF6932)